MIGKKYPDRKILSGYFPSSEEYVKIKLKEDGNQVGDWARCPIKRRERKMLGIISNAMYLGGSLMFCGFLLLPVLFLLSISVIYFVFDAIQNFRERRHLL